MSAHEPALPDNRLKGFEDEKPLTLSLPPRRPASPPPAAPADDPPQPAARKSSARPKQQQPTTPPEIAAPEDRKRQSNVDIPVPLAHTVASYCQTHRMSHGDLVITAIEAAIDRGRLPALISPAGTTGGSVFTARPTRVVRPAVGPLTALTFRFTERDFAALDGVVAESGAASRAQLIALTLADYLGAEQ